MRADMAAGLEPADPQSLAVALDPFGAFAETAGLMRDGQTWADWARLYTANLRDLPGDIVVDAFAEIMRTWHYRSMPLPGDVRLLAEPKLEARWQRRNLIEALAARIAGPRVVEGSG